MSRRTASLFALLALCLTSGVVPARSSAQRPPVVVASKPFGESFLLAEMFAQLLESRGIEDASEVCKRLGDGVTAADLASGGSDSPEAVFQRLGG